MKKYMYKNIQTTFLVGTPEQEIQLSACLGEYTTFIIQKNSKGYNETKFNKSISNSFSSFTEKPEQYLFQIFNKGIHSKDNFNIEKRTIINNLEFILATEVGVNQCHTIYCEVLTEPGILGFLNKEKYNEINVTKLNFINQLKKFQLISGYYFNFHFVSENSGNIIIGEKPHEYDNIHYKEENYLRIGTTIFGSDIDWWILFDKVYYGDEKTNSEKPILLRIEFGLIIGDFPWQKELENNFFNKFIEENKCFKEKTDEETTTDRKNVLTYYYCNKNIDLSEFKPFTFVLNDPNYNFTLTKDDLFIEEDDKYIFLMVFGKYELIFGFPFLKKYQMIFNQDSKTIEFYSYISNSTSNSTPFSSSSTIYYYIVIVILIILFLGLLAFIIIDYFKRMKKKKKNAKELSNEENENSDDKNKILVNDENEIN